MSIKEKLPMLAFILAIICIVINVFQQDWMEALLWLIIALQDKIIMDYGRR